MTENLRLEPLTAEEILAKMEMNPDKSTDFWVHDHYEDSVTYVSAYHCEDRSTGERFFCVNNAGNDLMDEIGSVEELLENYTVYPSRKAAALAFAETEDISWEDSDSE